MGWRVKVKVGDRILYSKSYSSEEKARKAKRRTRGGQGVVRS